MVPTRADFLEFLGTPWAPKKAPGPHEDARRRVAEASPRLPISIGGKSQPPLLGHLPGDDRSCSQNRGKPPSATSPPVQPTWTPGAHTEHLAGCRALRQILGCLALFNPNDAEEGIHLFIDEEIESSHAPGQDWNQELSGHPSFLETAPTCL